VGIVGRVYQDGTSLERDDDPQTALPDQGLQASPSGDIRGRDRVSQAGDGVGRPADAEPPEGLPVQAGASSLFPSAALAVADGSQGAEIPISTAAEYKGSWRLKGAREAAVVTG
jgi:hypothetical protein